MHRPPFLGTLVSLILAGGTISLSAEQPTSQWIFYGPDGKLHYKTTPAGDRIMDFSYAGYMGGGVALPTVRAKRTLQPSGDDDTATIQAAVDEVAAMPLENGFRGAVELAPGTFNCSATITIAADGVVLRGSGATGDGSTTIKMTGRQHLAVRAQGPRGRGAQPATAPTSSNTQNPNQGFRSVQSTIADAYVPSGSVSFKIADGAGFAIGDTIAIRRPVTEAWIRFMQMDNLVRDGRGQTWLRAGTTITTERKIANVTGNTITLDVPLADSFDQQYLQPPGTAVVKIQPPQQLSQVGIENLHIECPPQEINHTEPHFTALRINGEDCWVRDVVADETMNSIAVSGRRITLTRVAVNRKARHQGSSKPAEFAPNGGQILLDRCTVNGDNIWYSATGGRQAGPIVLLNCVFSGNGRAESHQRWTTGVLFDHCRAPDGGLDFRNRGAMGSGHGWSMGWGVAWNCEAADFVIQNPPGAINWMIGCIGQSRPMSRPFDKSPNLPEGVIDSPGTHVTPASLYLAQLLDRLGPQALKNIGY
jgi:hypothetical protein